MIDSNKTRNLLGVDSMGLQSSFLNRLLGKRRYLVDHPFLSFDLPRIKFISYPFMHCMLIEESKESQPMVIANNHLTIEEAYHGKIS